MSASISFEVKEPMRSPDTRAPNSKRKPGAASSAMNWVALRMLSGYRAKYLALVFAVSFQFLLDSPRSLDFCRPDESQKREPIA